MDQKGSKFQDESYCGFMGNGSHFECLACCPERYALSRALFGVEMIRLPMLVWFTGVEDISLGKPGALGFSDEALQSMQAPTAVPAKSMYRERVETRPWSPLQMPFEAAVAFFPHLQQWQSAVRDALLEAGFGPDDGNSYVHVKGTQVSSSIFDDTGNRHSTADLLQHAYSDNIQT